MNIGCFISRDQARIVHLSVRRNHTEKHIAHHAHYTYRVTWSEDDQEYVGLYAEFASLSWLAPTPEAALEGIREIVEEDIKDLGHTGEVVPEPIVAKSFSGKFMVRVPPEIHRRLALGDFSQRIYASGLPLCPGAALSRQLHSVAMRLARSLAPEQICGAISVDSFSENALEAAEAGVSLNRLASVKLSQ